MPFCLGAFARREFRLTDGDGGAAAKQESGKAGGGKDPADEEQGAAPRGARGSASMHFWIDKRSQCGYGGRRVPTSLSSGSGRPRRERRAKRMVTPVHRFQSVERAAGSGRRPAPPAAPSRPLARRHSPAGPAAPALAAAGVSHSDGPVAYAGARNAIDTDGVYLEMPPRRADAAPPPARPSPPPRMMSGPLKCGMWASFGLASMFLTGTKLYFDHRMLYERGTGMEMIVLCALFSVLLLGACTISLCRARAAPPMPVFTHRPSSPPTGSQDSNEDLALGTILSMQVSHPPGPPSPEPPPPPYHIAVLLPQRAIIQAEVPPPTYEKAIS